MLRFLCLTGGVPTAGGTGGAAAVLQPGAVGEGVTLVWRPGRGQTLLEGAQRILIPRSRLPAPRLEHGERAHHAGVIVLCGLRLVLLHHTG